MNDIAIRCTTGKKFIVAFACNLNNIFKVPHIRIDVDVIARKIIYDAFSVVVYFTLCHSTRSECMDNYGVRFFDLTRVCFYSFDTDRLLGFVLLGQT